MRKILYGKNRTIQRELVAKTPAQRRAFDYFAWKHHYKNIRAICYHRSPFPHWTCLVGNTSYFVRPRDMLKKLTASLEEDGILAGRN